MLDSKLERLRVVSGGGDDAGGARSRTRSWKRRSLWAASRPGVVPPDDDGATPTESRRSESIRSSVSPPASVCSSIRVSVTTSHSFCGLAEGLLELRRVETQPDMRLRSAGGSGGSGGSSFMSSICGETSSASKAAEGVLKSATM